MSAPDRFDSASFWMPSYTHWKIPYSTRKFNAVPIPIVKVLLDQLRFLKHKDYDLLTQPRYPPLALPGSLLLRPQYWQTFLVPDLPLWPSRHGFACCMIVSLQLLYNMPGIIVWLLLHCADSINKTLNQVFTSL